MTRFASKQKEPKLLKKGANIVQKEAKNPSKGSKYLGKSIFESETPTRLGSMPLLEKSTMESQLIKQKWASEDSLEDKDCPNIVSESDQMIRQGF